MAAGVWSVHPPDLGPWLRLPWLLGVGSLLYAVASAYHLARDRTEHREKSGSSMST